MTSRLRGRRVLLVLGALLALLAGGGVLASRTDEEARGRACTTKLGRPSSVGVVVGTRDAGVVTLARACLGARCRRLRQLSARVPGILSTSFAIPSRPGTRPVVLVLERPGQPAQVLSRRVRLQRHEANGPGCGTDWEGFVRYRDGKLVRVPYADLARYVRG